jgi:hypothetical protein
MDHEERILVDIKKLKDSIQKIDSIEITPEEEEIIERAKNYREDCEYYLKKKDEITSLGCITYAHGLIDDILLNHHIK